GDAGEPCGADACAPAPHRAVPDLRHRLGSLDPGGTNDPCGSGCLMRGDFDFPTRVAFGAGRVEELPELVRGWGSRALVVTDRGVVGSGAARPVLDVLER